MRKEIGGEDEQGEGMDEVVMLPNGKKRLGSQGLMRPDGIKRPGGQTLPRGVDENDGSPSPDETKRLGNGEGKRGVPTGGSGGMFEVLADGEGQDDFTRG